MFYYHIHQSTKPNKDQFLKEHNHICHQHKGRYGYRRICVELNQTLAGQGMVINHKRVQRLMQAMGLKAKIRQQRHKLYASYQGEPKTRLKTMSYKETLKPQDPIKSGQLM